MKCDVYQSTIKVNGYVVVPSGTSMTSLPTTVQDEILLRKPWKTIDINSDPPPIGLDAAAAAANIEKEGYHIKETRMDIEEGEQSLRRP